MNCPSCNADVSDGDRYCNVCGARAGATVAVADPEEAEAEKMLAEANLYRMRAQWEQAEARCIDVMRADPNNVHAHSLLGDIYRDQGRYEEAGQWYKLALDLNPSSAADQAKLANVEQIGAKRLARDPGLPRSSGVGALGTQRLAGVHPLVWFRVLIGLGVVFIVAVVIILALRARNRPMARPSTETTVTPGASQLPLPPTVPGLSGQTNGPAPRRPSLTQPPVEEAPTDEAPVTPLAPEASAPASNGMLSDRESALQGYLSRPGGLAPGVAVASAAIDPRNQKAMVYLVRSSNGAVGEAARDAVLRDALRAAQLALFSDARLQRVTVNVRMRSAGRVEPYFAGDIDRQTAAALSVTGSPTAQLANAFADAWWAATPGEGVVTQPAPTQ